MSKEITPVQVAEQLKNGKDLSIIDVREKFEMVSGKIPEAKNIPLGEIALRKDELAKDQDYIIVCQSGGRSKAACGLLEANGYHAVNMVGGMNEWKGNIE